MLKSIDRPAERIARDDLPCINGSMLGPYSMRYIAGTTRSLSPFNPFNVMEISANGAP
jgi:hypothetical protein